MKNLNFILRPRFTQTNKIIKKLEKTKNFFGQSQSQPRVRNTE